MPKKVILDLDYTLLKSREFRDEILPRFFGMSIEEFNNFYKERKKENIHYSPLEHIRETGRSQADFEEMLKTEINKYLFPETKEVLELFKKKYGDLSLLTFGEKAWHKLKVRCLTKISEYFNEIIYEDKEKSDSGFIKKLKEDGREVIMINDNLKESVKLSEKFEQEGIKYEFYMIEGPYSGKDKKEDLEKTGSSFKNFYFYKDLRELISAEEDKEKIKN